MDTNNEHGDLPGNETPPKSTPPAEGMPDYPDTETRELWYRTLAQKTLGGGRGSAPKSKPETQSLPYKPSLYYRMFGKRSWGGPVYFTERRRRADVLHIVAQMSALIRTNAPLVEGLDMLAAEERWIAKQMGAKRVIDFFIALLLLAVPVLFGLNLAFRDPMMTLMETMTVPIPFILCGLILFFLASQRGHRAETIFLCLRDNIASGMQVHEAMRIQRRVFPGYCLDIIQAGEEGGCLSRAFEQVADIMTDVMRLARHGFLTMLYVGFVSLFCSMVCAFLCIKVLPVFADMLNEFGEPIPPISRSLLATADFVNENFWNGVLPSLLGVLAFLWLFSKFFPKVIMGPIAGRLFLLLPLLRGLTVYFNTAHISRLLGALFGTGTPAPEALAIATRADVAPAYRALLHKAQQTVLEGESISASLQSTHLFPKSFLAMLALGERSGDLPRALNQMAAYYGALYETRAKMLVDGLLPIGVIFLGFLVMFVHIGSFSMLISMSTGLANTL